MKKENINMNSIMLAVQTTKSKRMPTARLPIEIEYWYVLPVLRRELAKSLKKEGKLRQKEIANILGISESAVSQYLKGTRASLENDNGEIPLPNWLQKAILNSTNKILKFKTNPMTFLTEMNNLMIKIREKPSHFLCKIHRSFGTAQDDCVLCIDLI